MKSKAKLFLAGLLAALFVCGCGTLSRTGQLEPRRGDEIVAAGQFFHTGTRVVLWLDPGGYDAYRVERRFAPIEKSDWSNSCAEVKSLKTPNRLERCLLYTSRRRSIVTLIITSPRTMRRSRWPSADFCR